MNNCSWNNETSDNLDTGDDSGDEATDLDKFEDEQLSEEHYHDKEMQSRFFDLDLDSNMENEDEMNDVCNLLARTDFAEVDQQGTHFSATDHQVLNESIVFGQIQKLPVELFPENYQLC